MTSMCNFRFTCAENREALQQLKAGYDPNIIGMVIEGILLIHKDKEITYTLNEEADKLYEKIIDKLNDQFNLKYTTRSQLSESQPELNNNEKSELSVCTKGTEIIGRLTCSLWIYCKGTVVIFHNLFLHYILIKLREAFIISLFFFFFTAFMCVLQGRPVSIGTEIDPEYVHYAEEIADVSYSQAETFSSALLNPSSGPTYTIGKPKLPIQVKVIQSLIRSAGQVVNVRTIVKNIRDKATEIIKGKSTGIYMLT